ncbi:hypothetical protein [Staphylococcus warneri]|nr:hypothetical protein [Staphylococcus warneri]
MGSADCAENMTGFYSKYGDGGGDMAAVFGVKKGEGG